MRSLSISVVFVVLCLVCFNHSIQAQTSTFTYQGRLIDGGVPATGQYDLTFKLYDQMVSGTQAGTDVVVEDVQVTAGIFTVTLDFGNQFPGANRFMEISVRPGASVGTFTILTPRQPLTSTPYSVKAAKSTSADSLSAACVLCVTDAHIVSIDGSKVTGTVANAVNATTATNALQLGGVAANQYVQTTDPRMTDARTPTAGSTNYVQNTTTPQATSNFNVSGNGTVGGTLSSNAVNATTQYNIGGNRVFSVAGAGNVFAGVGAGTVNTGGNNAFFGQLAGNVNTSGVSGSFFGQGAGVSNTTGGSNSFFGRGAGQGNATGNNNSFFGSGAGQSNTTGSNNTIIGYDSDVNSEDLTFATAIGAGVVVSTSNTIQLGRNNGFDTVQVPGAMNVTGALTANGSSITNVNAANITTGTLNLARLNNGVILNATSPQATSNFNISGTGTAAILNAATQYNIGGNRFLSVAGVGNLFAGVSAGASNTAGSNNSFFGGGAGFFNATGGSNSFFGALAGQSNTTGSNNTVIGNGANVGSGNLTFATGIGAGTTVSASNTVMLGRNADTVQVPGAMNVTGALTANGSGLTNLNANSITTGALAIANGGTGSATKNFVDLTTNQTAGGNKTFTGVVGVPGGINGNGSGLTNINGANITNNTINASALAPGLTVAATTNFSLLGSLRWDLLKLQNFAVGAAPYGVAFDGANMWVTNNGSNNVTKLRASDGALQGTFAVGSVPQGVAFDGANIWVVNNGDNKVSKLRASDGAIQGTFVVGLNPFGVAFDGANIWVVNSGDNNVTKLLASDGSNLGTFAVGSFPYAVAFDGANIWVTNKNSDNVTKLRASDGAVQGTFAVGFQPLGLAFDGENIWVASGSDVTKLRARDGFFIGRFGFGTSPKVVAFDGRSIWLTAGPELTRLRAFDGAFEGRFFLGSGFPSFGIAFDGANMWVTSQSGNNVTKMPVFP